MTTLTNLTANTVTPTNQTLRVPGLYGVAIYGIGIYGSAYQGALSNLTANTPLLTNQTAN